MKTIKQKVYFIFFLLLFLFLILNIEVFFVIKQESSASEEVEKAITLKNKINVLETNFWETRFWAKAFIGGEYRDAQKRFGESVKSMKSNLDLVRMSFIGTRIEGPIKNISSLLVIYEDSFNDLFQLYTEQGLDITDLDSKYFTLSTIIKKTNDPYLQKLNINFGIHHLKYVEFQREVQAGSLKVAIRTLQEIFSESSFDSSESGTNYLSDYKNLLDAHLSRRKEIETINYEINQINTNLVSQVEEVSLITEEFLENQVSRRNNFRTLIWILSLLILVIGIIILIIIIKSTNSNILTPIRALSIVVDKIKGGNMKARFSSKQRNEIAEFGITLNNMLDQITTSQLTLEKKQKELESSKSDLQTKNEELEKFNKLAVGRELKMVELKRKIKELEEKLQSK